MWLMNYHVLCDLWTTMCYVTYELRTVAARFRDKSVINFCAYVGVVSNIIWLYHKLYLYMDFVLLQNLISDFLNTICQRLIFWNEIVMKTVVWPMLKMSMQEWFRDWMSQQQCLGHMLEFLAFKCRERC